MESRLVDGTNYIFAQFAGQTFFLPDFSHWDLYSYHYVPEIEDKVVYKETSCGRFDYYLQVCSSLVLCFRLC